MLQHIVYYLQGKSNPFYRHDKVIEGRDVCVIINASKMKFTGKKIFHNKVKYHTGYVGHLRQVPYWRFIQSKPEQLVQIYFTKLID